MKKIITLLSMATLLSFCAVFTSCSDRDADEAMVLRGEWTGDWKMSYETHLGHVFTADYTDIVFYTNSSYTNRGYGYQVDFYSYGPYTEIYSRFNWSINGGVIYITYPDDHWYDTEIYEYYLNDRHFTGYLGDSYLYFDLTKIAGFRWDYYYGHGEYYYWDNLDYYWDDGDYFFYSKKRGAADADSTATVTTPNEPERIVRIGSNLGK